jgi:hypothetical protein
VASENRPIGRPPDKLNEILAELRGQIISGLLAPGKAIPPRSQLKESFRAGPYTIQRALDSLKNDGFVSISQHGTYVSDNPPHLSRYAMTFPSRPSESPGWSRFARALHDSAMRFHGQHSKQFDFYFSIDAKEASPDFGRLIKDTERYRFGGILFTTPPYALWGRAALKQPDMPRVAIMHFEQELGIPAVTTDTPKFIATATSYLLAKGRRRVAVLAIEDPSAGDAEGLVGVIRCGGLTTYPYWVQACPYENTRAASRVVQLLMQGRELPDALIIADDHLVEHACAGLIAAGVRVPDDIEVVAHCNYPNHVPAVLPVKRLGFDCGEIVRRCVEIMEMQRRGEDVPDQTLIVPQFEDDLVPQIQLRPVIAE